jgi:hypothetical protein
LLLNVAALLLLLLLLLLWGCRHARGSRWSSSKLLLLLLLLRRGWLNGGCARPGCAAAGWAGPVLVAATIGGQLLRELRAWRRSSCVAGVQGWQHARVPTTRAALPWRRAPAAIGCVVGEAALRGRAHLVSSSRCRQAKCVSEGCVACAGLGCVSTPRRTIAHTPRQQQQQVPRRQPGVASLHAGPQSTGKRTGGSDYATDIAPRARRPAIAACGGEHEPLLDADAGA